MKKVMNLLLITLCLFLFVGCDVVSNGSEVEEYNMHVAETLVKYETIKTFAESNKDRLLSFLKGETNSFYGINLKDSMTGTAYNNLRVVSDYFFINSNNIEEVKEVLIIVGEIDMFVEVTWGTDGVVSVTRRCINWT